MSSYIQILYLYIGTNMDQSIFSDSAQQIVHCGRNLAAIVEIFSRTCSEDIVV